MAEIDIILQAKTIQGLLSRLTGRKPELIILETKVKLQWKQEDIKYLQDKFMEKMETPQEVEIDIYPILKPYINRKATPLLLGSGIAGFMLNEIFK